MSSCSVMRHVPDDEALVTDAQVQWAADAKIENKRDLRFKLADQIKQEPNERLFGVFGRVRLWAYYQTDSPSDSSQIDRWARKSLAEPPVLYDAEKTQSSAQAMENLLRKRGYWDASVAIDTVRGFKSMKVSYLVDPDQRYYFDSLTYRTSDSSILRILDQTRSESFLQRGQPVTETRYRAEVQRIVSMLRDSGFYGFSGSYMPPLEIVKDTQHYVDAVFPILPPSEGDSHLRYRIGDINIYTHYAPEDNTPLYSHRHQGLDFHSIHTKLPVRPQVLKRQIYLEEGSLYQASAVEKTNRQLSQLELYRFISISPKLDSSRPSVLDYDIYLLPRPKRAIGYDIELNTTSLPISNSLIGGMVNFNWVNRNFFRGAETLNIQSGFRIEFPRSIRNFNNIITSLELENSVSIQFPSFITPLGIYKNLGRVRLDGKQLRATFLENTQTRMLLGYNYVLFRDFYEYARFNAEMTYLARPSANTSLTLTPTGIDYLSVNTFQRFEEIQRRNPFLLRSFSEQQLFTGFLFRNIDYLWRSPTNASGRYWRINTRFELSGWEALFIEGIANAFSPAIKDTLSIAGVPFSHFAIGELDVRYYQPIGLNNSWAYRAASSIGLPFGTSREVPYIKQFFVGGPTSIRAFQIREVGPGGFYDFVAVDSSFQFYQTGDFRFEFNLEYRFDLFWFFKGALFLDGGNVWTLGKDPARPGSQLQWLWSPHKNEDGYIIADHFLNQLALGTGFGLRVDLNYFILRLDLGFPIRNNYPNPDRLSSHFNSYWRIHSLDDIRFKDLNFNLAIGYPF